MRDEKAHDGSFQQPTSIRQRGFTLVEVLVALAVLAIALASVMRVVSQAIDTSIALRDRAEALWLAENRLVMRQLKHDWPAPDTTTGTEEYDGREWYWREQVRTTSNADLRQIEIEVRAGEDRQVLGRLVGLLRKPG